MSVYVIEHSIVFDSDVPSLASTGQTKQDTAISAAAARCLVVLIESEGEPVLREQLLHAGWGAVGQVVSENSLNQAITQIRKVMKELELKGELILTVPRLGYKISRLMNIQIKLVVAEALPTLPTSIEQQRGQPREITYNVASSENRRGLIVVLFSGTVRPVLLMLVWVAASCTLFYLTNKPVIQQMMTKFHTVNYLPLASQFNNLNIFYNDGIEAKSVYLQNAIKQFERDSWLLKKLGAEVQYIYINGSYNHDVFSYFICEDEIQRQPQSCHAYTSIQEGH